MIIISYIFGCLLFLVAIWLQYRLSITSKFMDPLFLEIKRLAYLDIDKGNFDTASYRIDQLNSVPYEKILLSFKKPTIENFWDDTSFVIEDFKLVQLNFPQKHET